MVKKGEKWSPELRAAMLGRKSRTKGIIPSKEQKENQSRKMKEWYLTHEVNNKGKKQTEQRRLINSISHRGIKPSKEQLVKMSIIMKQRWADGAFKIGTESPNWRGGTTIEQTKRRKSVEGKAWKMSIFERDNFTCKKCGYRPTSGVKEIELNAHHIKPFAEYAELRYELSNGITWCKICHVGYHINQRKIEKQNKLALVI